MFQVQKTEGVRGGSYTTAEKKRKQILRQQEENASRQKFMQKLRNLYIYVCSEEANYPIESRQP